jgi:ADP-heptose:LPS heptosyltransferase
MRAQAEIYVSNKNFDTKPPQALDQKFDIIYLVYVLQHVPAIEIREVLTRIYHLLKSDGIFVYCSSDYRMAIRYDGQGFFDDRFLGVDLQSEVSRLFKRQGPLFNEKTFEGNMILRRMITGKTEGADDGLPHPAFFYKKRKITGPVFNALAQEEEGGSNVEQEKGKEENKEEGKEDVLNGSWMRSRPKKILLLNRLAPGDILVMTNAIRDLNKAHPGEYLVDVRTPCNEIFENNPYITKLQYDEAAYQKINQRFSKMTQDDSNKIFKRIKDGEKEAIRELLDQIGDVLVVDMHYPLIHESGVVGHHFSQGHRSFLEQVLEIQIPQTDLRPQIYLSQAETDWPSPALVKEGVQGPYWVLNAGAKSDNVLKQYPFFQEVVDRLKDKITFVQIGQASHLHAPLSEVVDMRGKTNVRELFRLIAKAEGVVSCVSFPMHIAAAFSKPCVVVAGAREGTRWELYPNHQFLYVNGCLACAPYDGCWRGVTHECNNKKEGIPLCMLLIRPDDVAWAVERYYVGGILEREKEAVNV